MKLELKATGLTYIRSLGVVVCFILMLAQVLIPPIRDGNLGILHQSLAFNLKVVAFVVLTAAGGFLSLTPFKLEKEYWESRRRRSAELHRRNVTWLSSLPPSPERNRVLAIITDATHKPTPVDAMPGQVFGSAIGSSF